MKRDFENYCESLIQVVSISPPFIREEIVREEYEQRYSNDEEL
jgi:hypothetical protein